MIDRSAEKARRAGLLEEETAQIEEARRWLASGRPLRLSTLGGPGRAEFDLLLDLLGEALARRVRPSDAIEATSSDGSLAIALEAPLDAASSRHSPRRRDTGLRAAGRRGKGRGGGYSFSAERR